jgi:signal transduction histidine kinase
MFVGLYNLWDTWNASRMLLNRSTAQQARLAATAFEQWVNTHRQTLSTISDLAQTGSEGNTALSEYVNSVMKTRPAWLNIEIVSPGGEIVLAQSAKKWNLQATPLANLKAEIDQKKSLVIVTEQIADKQISLLSLAMPLPDGNFVVARIDGRSPSDVFNQLELPEDHIIAVFDANNQLIYRSQVSPEQLSLDVSQTPLLNSLSGKGTGVIEVESPYDHVSRVYGLARVEPVNAVVAVGVPSADLYNAAIQQFNRQLLLSILIACLAVFAAFLIARSVVEPLRRLTAAAKAFGEGDLDARGGVENNPAVRELGLTFNKMAEKIAAREEKMKEVDQLKSDFVSSVSHELRTPLTTIKTLTRVLQRTNVTPRQQKEYLETISNECDRQIEFVQNLLDLSRLESGAYRPSLQKTDTLEILQSSVALQQKTAEARNQKLVLFVPEELPATEADPAAFRRVVTGLLENAIKYTPDHGRIEVIAMRDGDEVVIQVADNGCGIAEEDLSRIFEKFYRGRALVPAFIGNNGSQLEEGVATDAVPGVGLGLYLVKALVDQMGGKMEVNSPNADGRGATFIVSLPVYEDGGRGDTNDLYVSAETVM